jgi:hypothetical protein
VPVVEVAHSTRKPLDNHPQRCYDKGTVKQNTKGMTTRFTYDIQTQQLVYAIVDKDGVCKYLTTSITDAIKLTQQN